MSFVHLTIVHQNTIYHLNVHWRTAKRILEQGPMEFFKHMPGKDRDAGWIVADFDKNKVIHCQDALKIPEGFRFEIIEVK